MGQREERIEKKIESIMIIEDYVSYEIAKLLKEKGFDGECIGCYWDSKKTFDINYEPLSYSDGDLREEVILAPTHQMVLRWLREEHKIYADPMQQGNYDDNSIYYSFAVAQIIDGRSYIQRPMSIADKFTYEEAVEAAIKYSLENLI